MRERESQVRKKVYIKIGENESFPDYSFEKCESSTVGAVFSVDISTLRLWERVSREYSEIQEEMRSLYEPWEQEVLDKLSSQQSEQEPK